MEAMDLSSLTRQVALGTRHTDRHVTTTGINTYNLLSFLSLFPITSQSDIIADISNNRLCLLIQIGDIY